MRSAGLLWVLVSTLGCGARGESAPDRSLPGTPAPAPSPATVTQPPPPVVAEPPESSTPPRAPPGTPHCGPQGDDHCLVLELHPPEGVDVEALVARMRAEGLRVDHRDGLVTLSATDAEARSLFGATVVYRRVARSSGAGWRCSAYLQQPRVPTRYREHIRSVQVGHQLCE